MKILLTFIKILFLQHVGASAWMFVNKINSKNKLSYFVRFPENKSNLLITYVYSLSWSVEAITGNSFGEVNPKTINEMFIATIFIILGAFIYSKIFAGFDQLIFMGRRE